MAILLFLISNIRESEWLNGYSLSDHIESTYYPTVYSRLRVLYSCNIYVLALCQHFYIFLSPCATDKQCLDNIDTDIAVEQFYDCTLNICFIKKQLIYMVVCNRTLCSFQIKRDCACPMTLVESRARTTCVIHLQRGRRQQCAPASHRAQYGGVITLSSILAACVYHILRIWILFDVFRTFHGLSNLRIFNVQHVVMPERGRESPENDDTSGSGDGRQVSRSNRSQLLACYQRCLAICLVCDTQLRRSVLQHGHV